jgi:hypothetical protein
MTMWTGNTRPFYTRAAESTILLRRFRGNPGSGSGNLRRRDQKNDARVQRRKDEDRDKDEATREIRRQRKREEGSEKKALGTRSVRSALGNG